MKFFKILMLFSLVILLAACTKKSNIDFSNDYIYLKGGVMNIPNQENGTYTYDTTNHVLKVHVPIVGYGAARGAKNAVSVFSNPDTVNALIGSGQLNSTTLLSSSAFSFPNKFEIGTKDTSFIPITIDLDNVPNDIKRFALAIEISNPSKFSIYPAFKDFVLVVNKPALMYGGTVGSFKNLKDQKYLAVDDNNNLTISTTPKDWIIIAAGKYSLIRNIRTGGYIKHVGDYMNNGFTMGTFVSTDSSFYLHLKDVTSKYGVTSGTAYAIGNKDKTTCIDSYGNGTTGSWSYIEAVTMTTYPNRIWIFAP